MKIIPYGRQYISQEDIRAVIKAIKSDTITRGPLVNKFENVVCKKVGAKHGVAVNSATSALHIACLALGVSSGDKIWTVPNTFVASANCGRYCGAKVNFVDIDPNTWNISIIKLTDKLRKAKKNNSLPKVLVSVHFAGQPTEQEKIRKLSKQYGFFVIEDASHSLGAKRNGEHVGSCKWSDITVFSFHPVKAITTGEGGMAITNSLKLASKMKIFRNHGIVKDVKEMKKKSNLSWYYEQKDLGYNYWMSDIQAALGINQIKKIKTFINKRNKIAKFYDDKLVDLPIQKQTILKGNYSAFHLYVIRIKIKKIKEKYNKIFRELRAKKIGINLHYLSLHLQPYYKKFGFKKGDFPNSENYSNSAISLPIYYNLKKTEQIKVINIVRNIIKKCL
tara:strand:+ start:3596 stop:4768 length:1173 start_codon:yes stop_codon:yes gene_type:complete